MTNLPLCLPLLLDNRHQSVNLSHPFLHFQRLVRSFFARSLLYLRNIINLSMIFPWRNSFLLTICHFFSLLIEKSFAEICFLFGHRRSVDDVYVGMKRFGTLIDYSQHNWIFYSFVPFLRCDFAFIRIEKYLYSSGNFCFVFYLG